MCENCDNIGTDEAKGGRRESREREREGERENGSKMVAVSDRWMEVGRWLGKVGR